MKIIKNEVGIFVKKTAANISYNERLKSQCKKQLHFSSAVFSTIKVYEQGYDNDLYFFTMQYIKGITLSDYMNYIKLDETENLIKNFTSLIPDSIIYDPLAKNIFTKKIESLSNFIINNQQKNFIEAIDILNDFSWKYISKSSCHGDFTLENILISDGTLYVFDFLDSFYESWIIDIAKVLQDVELYWSYRTKNEINNNLLIRLLVLRDGIIKYILNIKDGIYLVETVYYVLLLNTLRILPYAKDECTMKWIEDKTIYLLEKIKNKIWRTMK